MKEELSECNVDVQKDCSVVAEMHGSNCDDYIASIELSNKCRDFYRSRLQAAEIAKKKLNANSTTGTKYCRQSDIGTVGKGNTSIHNAMDTLRREMTSLMDQDLSLMEQLLNLNEAVEDLKFRRRNYVDKKSLQASSCDFSSSDWSVSETDLYESSNDLLRKYPSPSCLSLHSRLSRQYDSIDLLKTPQDALYDQTFQKKDKNKNYIRHHLHQTSTPKSDVPEKLDLLSNNKTIPACHGDQDSYDSGIHEVSSPEELLSQS